MMYQSAIFEITRECNLNCRYCSSYWKADSWKHYQQKTEVSSTFCTRKKIIKNLSAAGIRHLTISGGEPLGYPRLTELVLAARLRRMSVSINTNGTLGSESLYRHLIRLGVSSFSIPCHSHSNENHDRMTGTPGTWRMAQNTMDIIKNLKGTVIPSIVLSKVNYQEIYQTLQFLCEKGFRRININRFNLKGSGYANRSLLEWTKEQLNQAHSLADSAARDFGLQLSSTVCTSNCRVAPNKFPHIQFLSCAIKKEQMPVTVNEVGNIRICSHSPKTIGNILSQKLPEILENSSLNNARNLVPATCLSCGSSQKCLGGCKTAAEQAGAVIHQTDPILQKTPSQV